MTYDGKIKKLLMKRYPEAFKYTPPVAEPTMVVLDMMQWVKTMPDEVNCVEHVVRYLVARCMQFMRRTTAVLVVCWDKSSPVVKKIVCHTARYAKVKVCSPEEAPILPADPRESLKARELHGMNWMRFAGNAHNLRRELGPRLVNAFMNAAYVKPRVGQVVLLDGFPLNWRKVHVFEKNAARFGDPQYGVYNTQQVPAPWNIDESGDGFGQVPLKEHSEDYTRVLGIYGVEPSEQCPQGVWYEERPEMANSIAEADNSIFFYDHFFPKLNQLLVINDGDAISIGLLYARERLEGARLRNTQTLCLKNTGEHKAKGAYLYLDLNVLFCAMEEDRAFHEAGVNNHVLPWVFLGIVAGNDFFGNFCKGIGLETIVKTYMEMLPFFANLLQYNVAGMPPSTRTLRRVVVDEELFVQLVHHTYVVRKKTCFLHE